MVMKNFDIPIARPSTFDRQNLSLMTLPVEVIYRILDNLDILTILTSLRNVCTRLNDIIDDYHRFKVRTTVDFN